MSAITRCLILGLLSLLLVGCRSGGPEAPQPQILSVSPTGTAGVTTSTIDFAAEVDSDQPFTLQWHFGSGTDPSTSPHFTPTVTLLDPGTYPATVDLIIDSEIAQSFAFEYTIAAPPEVTAVSPTGTVGATRAFIDFEAAISGEFDDLVWTFSDGTTFLSQMDKIANTRVLTAGDFFGTVTASQDGVNGAAFPFSYTVTTPVTPTWLVDDVAPAGPTQSNIAMVEHLGRIAIAFQGLDGIHVAQALTDEPHGPSDWQDHRVGPGLFVGAQTAVSRNNHLVLSYVSGQENAQNRIAVAQSETPVSGADWATMDLSEVFIENQDRSLQNDPAGPLWLISDGGEFGLTVWRCDAVLPQVAADWESHQLIHFDEPSLLLYGRLNSLLTSAGLQVAFGPGNIFSSSVTFARSKGPSPSSASDWSVQSDSTTAGTDDPVFPLRSESGNPLLIRRHMESLSLWHSLVVQEALTLHPASQADWVDHVVGTSLFVANDFDDGTDRRVSGFGGEFFGRAAYLHRATNVRQLILFRQVGDDVTNPEHWLARPIPSGGDPTWAYSMLATDGRLVVAWIDQPRNVLRVAQANGPF